MFYEKTTKKKTTEPKKREKKFPMARVGPQASDEQGYSVIYCATATNIKKSVKLIIFNTFGHEILPVDAV